MRTKLTTLALTLTGLVASAAQAADNGFYLGAGVARSDLDAGLPRFSSMEHTGFKALAGLRLLDSFGVELSYADHGSETRTFDIACIALAGAECPNVFSVRARTASAFAVGFLALPVVDLFAKAGLSYADASIRSPNAPSLARDDSGTEFAWGAGVQAHFLSVAVRAEYERFEVFDRKLEMVSASLIYTFL